jgi:hypothetical protein
MKREEIEKLLGGYVTGTLTAEEREALFAAALEDQQLFDAMLQEEPLREALEDPAARARLLATLDESPNAALEAKQPWYYREVHPGLIAAIAAAILISTLAVKFWPVRIVPPINVVARGDMPLPSKSVLPSKLPPFRPGEITPHDAVPRLPEAPVISFGPGRTSPEVDRTLDKLLAANPPVPPPSPLNVELARNSILPRARTFRPVSAPAPSRLRYTILKKAAGGQFTPVDGGQRLDPTDETVIRFEPSEAGFLYVSERSAGGWQRIATEQVQPLVAVTIPREGTFHDEGKGPRELQVLFSREPQNEPERVVPVQAFAQQTIPGLTTTVVAATAQRPEPIMLLLTLRYPPR